MRTRKRIAIVVLGMVFLAGIESLFLEQLFAYRQNNYSLAWSGAKSAALGRSIAVGSESFNFVYHNPALLLPLEKSFLLYEIKTDLKYLGFRTDYSIQYDGIAAFALVHPFTDSAFRYIGVSYHTVFDSLDRNNYSYYFELKKLGVSTSYSFNQNQALGINVGVVLGIERNNIKRLSAVIAPSLQISYKQRLTSSVVLGGYFLSPHYLDWSVSGNPVQEWTPFILGVGSRFDLPFNFKLYTEINYQGWDLISYTENDKQKFISRGDGSFDLFQDVFLALGVHYKSDLKAVSREERARLNQAISRLTAQNKTLLLDEIILDTQKEMQFILAKIVKLVDEIKALKYKNNSNEQIKKQLRAIQTKKRDILLSLKEIKKSEAESQKYIFSDNAALLQKRQEYESRLKKLEVEENALIEKRNNQLKTVDVQRQEQMVASLKAQYKNLQSDLIKRKKIDQALYVKALTKQRANMSLSLDEEKILALKRKKDVNDRKIKELQRQKRGSISFLPVKGDYYLGFYSDVYYSALDPSYNSMGNLTAGFSFKPFNIDFLTFHISIIDKSLLKLIGLYPNNSLQEYIQVSVELTF